MESSDHRQAPRSRRERPAKPALTRDGIIAAALTILRDEGLEKVTMRRIAAALDTGPASLYVYVRNTEDLHAQILDALLGSINVPIAADGDWRDRLYVLLTDYMRLLLDHPEIARMAISTQPSGPNYLGLGDAILGLLREGGVPDRETAWAVGLFLLIVTANAVEHSSRTSARVAGEFSALASAIASADATRYPNIVDFSSDLLSGSPRSRIQWMLDVILAGALAVPVPNSDQR